MTGQAIDEAPSKRYTFDEIRRDGALRWEVKKVNQGAIAKCLDVEEILRGLVYNFDRLTQKIGQDVLDGGVPDPNAIRKAREAREQIQLKNDEIERLKQEMRTAMENCLREMLSEDLSSLDRQQLESFFEDLVDATSVQINASRLLGQIRNAK